MDTILEGYGSSSSFNDGRAATPANEAIAVPVVTQEVCSQKQQKQQQQEQHGMNGAVVPAATVVGDAASTAAAEEKEVEPPQTTATLMNGEHAEAAAPQPQPPQQQQQEGQNEEKDGNNNNIVSESRAILDGDGDVVVAAATAAGGRPTKGYSSRLPTPSSQGVATAAGATDGGATTSERKRFKQHHQHSQHQHHHQHHYPLYGIPISVKEGQGRFPQVGSTLGPFFCLGQLGKGTFSSIHKCINLEFFRRKEQQHQQQQKQKHQQTQSAATGATATAPAPPTVEQCRRLAAAKVELSTFAQSGVLESEAAVLEFLHKSTPPATVPVYMGHYKSGNKYAALVMEYLPGEDMHQLREKIMMQSNCRRLAVQDAVYLAADVMLPLLQRLHQVGIVHRDVKPSNCVRSGCGSGGNNHHHDGGLDEHLHHSGGDTSSFGHNNMNGSISRTDAVDKAFCLVDFGLSKSIVVPADSPFADKDHPWGEGKDWLKPQNYTGSANYRMERSKADFRGTSMYASLRVHQLKDYCPRDDVWSVLYVFCDLVSGGLPWMSYAANRNRDMCQTVKERVHGEATEEEDHQSDEMELLLMGDHYHLASFRRSQKEAAAAAATSSTDGTTAIDTGATNYIRPLPEPLKMSQDKKKVDLLRTAFQHLAKLQFWEQPDYDLIGRSIRGFLETPDEDPAIQPIDWRAPNAAKFSSPPTAAGSKRKRMAPRWDLLDSDGFDPIDSDTFPEAEAALLNDEIEAAHDAATADHHDDESSSKTTLDKKRDTPLSRLPVEMRFRLEQLAFHVEMPDAVPHHIVLRDWLNATLPLLYEDWDARKYEDGGHRTSTDGYRREHYLQLLRQCQRSAGTFNFFRSTECFFVETTAGAAAVPPPPPAEQEGGRTISCKEESRPVLGNMSKRKIGSDDQKSAFVTLSRALIGLRAAIKAEEAKRSAPPMRISFGSNH
jgi:serine/threonine protein kinase